ncbi:MAG: hemolysin family protein [Bdellovibrionota bacterium]
MIEVLIVVFCLLLNALLSLVEMAFVSVSKPELKHLSRSGHVRANTLLKLRENPERTLSVLQIGITIVGALSAAVGGSGARETLVPYLIQNYNISGLGADIIAMTIVVLPLTYFGVVLGELVPKTIALRYPMKIALVGAAWLVLGEWLLSPFVRLLEKSTQLVLRILFPTWKKKEFSTTEEAESVNIATLSGAHRQFVINLVHIETKRIRDIMLPWSQVDHVKLTDSLNDVLSVVIKSGHTRLPVMSEDKVIGLLHSKEYLSFVSSGDDNWKKIIREAILLSPSEGILKTLKMMQEKKSHLGIVFQGSSIVGIVTLEDIIEEIVGDISDEDDDGKLKRILSARVMQKTSKL